MNQWLIWWLGVCVGITTSSLIHWTVNLLLKQTGWNFSINFLIGTIVGIIVVVVAAWIVACLFIERTRTRDGKDK